jgi:membrane protein YqaA with SNARE-associated domain
MRRLYDWVLHFETSPHAGRALFCLAFAESSVFPVPPDVLLIALSLSAPVRALRYALVCTAGSVLGGLAGYGIGWLVWVEVQGFFFAYVFSPDLFSTVARMYQENAFWAVFTAGFTPIPYKVFTIASGVFETGVGVLVAASVLGRGLRFFAVAALMNRLGPKAKEFIDRYFNWLTLLFFVLLALGFLLIRKLL